MTTANPLQDKLRSLFLLCDYASISSNDHRDCYRTVEEEIKKRNPKVSEDILAGMIESNVWHEITIHPIGARSRMSFIGHDFISTLNDAFTMAVMFSKEACPEGDDIILTDEEENATLNYVKLTNTCRASVGLTFNEWRDDRVSTQDGPQEATAENHLRNHIEWEDDEESTEYLTEGLIAAMCEPGSESVFRIHAYPNTPVGSYSFYGLNSHQVIKTMLQLCTDATRFDAPQPEGMNIELSRVAEHLRRQGAEPSEFWTSREKPNDSI